MWASLIALLKNVFVAIGSIVQWIREEDLRADGERREALRRYEDEAKARSIADEIDRRPVPHDKRAILIWMCQGDAAPINVGGADRVPTGDHPVAGEP